VTVTGPPRPPRSDDPVTREELEALVEALIEEARQRARRRRRIYVAAAAVIVVVAGVVVTVLQRTANQQTSSPVAARSGVAGGAVDSKIAFISEPLNSGYGGVTYVMNADGSERQRLAPGHLGSWSPDGQKIAFAAGAIHVTNVDGSGHQTLTNPVYHGLDHLPAWSPDGRAIAFIRYQPSDESEELWVMSADGSRQRRLARNAWHGTPAWSPDGEAIAFVSRRGHKSGSPFSGTSELEIINADGSGRRRLTHNAVPDRDPVWSPDGRRIAFVSNWQVYVINADGNRQRRLTRNGTRNLAPAWSPDGRRIAFESKLRRTQSSPCRRCGDSLVLQVYVMNADGSKQRRLTRKGARNFAPAWSPDGRTIAFVSKRDGNAEIYLMNADGSRQRNLTRTRNRHERSFVWSPAQKK
jgi:Tol biopolymer transport system component